jgi:hypothetical protein
MGYTDPYEAVLEHVADFPYRVQPPSVHVLKRRDLPGRQLYAVVFTNQEGLEVFCACELRQQEDGTWSVHGSAGGGLGGGRPSESPRANLGGSPGGQSSGCYFGGLVEVDSAGEVARVDLVSADGVTLDDSVEEGVVLFLGEGPVDLPLSAELYDRAGKLVAAHVVIRAIEVPAS